MSISRKVNSWGMDHLLRYF